MSPLGSGEDNRVALERGVKLAMPILALGGASSFFAPVAEENLHALLGHLLGVGGGPPG